MEKGMQEQRKEYIVVLRAIATVAVVMIHVASSNWYGNIGSLNWMVFSAYEGTCRFAVPIFFMISGALFLNGGEKKRELKYIINKIKRLVIFLLFWSMIYKFFQQPSYDVHGLLDNVKQILIGDTQAHLWYIYAIVGLYLLVPLLSFFCEEADYKTMLYVIILLVSLGGICDLFSYFPVLLPLSNNIAKIKTGFQVGYVGYFIIGAFLDKYAIFTKKRWLIINFAIFIIGSVVTVMSVCIDCISQMNLNERFWVYTMPSIYAASISFFVIVKNSQCPKALFGILKKISESSLGIYGVHMFFLIGLSKIGINTFLINGVLSVPVITLLVLLLSYASARILKQIPIVGGWIA